MDKVCLPGDAGKGDDWFLVQVNEAVICDHCLGWHKTGIKDKLVLLVAFNDEALWCEHEIWDEGAAQE